VRIARFEPLLRVAPLLFAAVLLSACTATLRVDVAVDRHGAGHLAVSLGADDELLAEAAAQGADPLGDLVGVGQDLATEGWRTRDTADASGRVVTLEAPFESPAAFERLAAELGEALAAPELMPFDGLRLELTEEEVRFTGEAGLVPTTEVTTLGVQPEQAVEILDATGALRYEVSVALPGPVIASNGQDGEEHGPVTWRIRPGEQVELLAVAERPRGSWVVLAAAGAAVGGVVLLLLALLRRWTSSVARRG
jgi:hypothetical protein